MFVSMIHGLIVSSITSYAISLVLAIVLVWRSLRERSLARQLRRAQHSLAEGAKLRALLVRHIGLDLRNGLNAVAGFTDLMLERPFPPEKLRIGVALRGSVDDLVGAMTNLMTYFSDLREIVVGPVETVDLPEMLARLQLGLLASANEKGIHLECHLEPGAPKMIMSHPASLFQALSNVLQHCVAATKQGLVELTVHAEPLASHAAEALMRVTIRDSSGLTSPTVLRGLFEPYGLEGVRFGGNPQGTGLHLIIARRLVRAVGGELFAAADGEDGTLYTLTFSAGVVETSRASQRIEPAQVVTLNNLYARHRRAVGVRHALVIDDQASNQELITSILQRAGHRTTGVSTGEEALKHLAETKFDVILVDLNLPGISGAELLRLQEVSSVRLNATTPMIVVTGDISSETRKECFRAGARAYVTKPVTARYVLDAIAAVFREEKAAAVNLAHTPLEDAQLIKLTPGVAYFALREALHYRQELAAAVENHDWDGARLFVRTIRGSAVTLDARGLIEVCRRFLGTSDADMPFSGEGLLLKIHAEIDDVRMELADGPTLTLDRDPQD